jgi:hypothetical protein
MRTITEFFGMSLKSAAEKVPGLNEEATKSAQEAMKAEGKSDEEIATGLPTAAKAALDAKIGETFKLEGEKLAMFANALEILKEARGSVKRIIVMAKANEEEKAPANAKEIDGKFYVVEGFPEPSRAAPRDERGGRGDKRGGQGGRGDKRGGGRGEGRGPRGEGRGPRGGDRPQGDAGAPGFQAVGGEGGRRPRAPRAPVEPYTGPNRIVIGGAKKDAPAASESGSSEPTTT